MICETCKAEGRTSRVYDRGISMTLLNCTPFYDEQGRLHDHDRNTTASGYECSNGHSWVVRSAPACWCGWPNEQKAAPVVGPTLYTRQQVETMLRVALTDRTDEWTLKTVDERVAALLSMFTLPTTKEKP